MLPGANFRRGEIEAFGYRIPVAEAGEGAVVISLPGSAGLEMSTAKDLLARQCRVIELDPPGWGETPELLGEMRQRDLAIVLTAAIERLGVDQFSLIGTSMGGTNALWLAEQCPDRVTKLILEGPMSFSRPEDLVHPESDGLIDAIRNGLTYDGGYPAPPPHPNKPWATADFFHEQMRRRFKMMRHTDYPGDVDRLDAWARRLTIPTTVLLGTEDEILRPSYVDQLRARIPHLHVILVDGATHDIQNSAPQAFVDAVLMN